MSIWKEIKHALNSTIGTQDPISLDKLIKGQRSLCGSDDIIAVISNKRQTGNYDYTKTFVPKVSGTIRIVAGYSDFRGEGSFVIKEDGAKIHEFPLPPIEGHGESSSDISITAHKVYSFKSGEGAPVNYVKIGAQIVDGSLFEVIEQNEETK